MRTLRYTLLALVVACHPVAATAAGSTKFCGRNIYKNPGKPLHTIPLTNLATFHNSLANARLFGDYVRRPSGTSTENGFVLWRHDQKLRFVPLYFVPSQMPNTFC